MRLKAGISRLLQTLGRRNPQKAPLTVEDYLHLESMKPRSFDASEIALLEECFGIGRDVTVNTDRVRKIA
jgi:hypothetical protein